MNSHGGSTSLTLEEEAEFLEDFKTEKGVLINPPIQNFSLSFFYTTKHFLPFHPEMQSPPPKSLEAF